MLNGKRILVTGANRGIGKAIAACCAAHGAKLLLHARRRESLGALADELRRKGTEVCCIAADLSEPGAGKTIVLEVRKAGGLDTLVNNAGIFTAAPLGMTTQGDLLNLFQVNLFSVFELTQYASRLMQQQGSGSIVNLTSIMGIQGAAEKSAYASSKAALIGFTRSLAKELAPSGIRVNAVAPGLIDTDMARTATPQQLEQLCRGIPMGRIGQPEEVAEAVAFLAGDRSSYISGQILGVDGVMTI